MKKISIAALAVLFAAALFCLGAGNTLMQTSGYDAASAQAESLCANEESHNANGGGGWNILP